MAYDRTIPVADDPVRAERLTAWARRKPCVALMGEFSAGKSTLLNFLIEEDLVPTRATATEVPPVWFSYGDAPSYWVAEDGARHPVAAAELASVPMSARHVRIFSRAEILEHCDIVDTPGISDPNLAAESWRFAAGVANMVLWCSTATQAWRETERSAWLSLPERLRRHSLLVVTRADKLVQQADRDKVQRRLVRETAGLFGDLVFLATPDAVRAKADLARGESSPLWESSGAGALLDRMAERFEAIYADRDRLLRRHLTGEEPVVAAEAVPEVAAPVADDAPAGPRPVRVHVGSPRRTERLRAEDADAVLARLRGDAPVSDEDGPLILGDAVRVDGDAADAALAAELPEEAAPAPEAHRPGQSLWFGARDELSPHEDEDEAALVEAEHAADEPESEPEAYADADADPAPEMFAPLSDPALSEAEGQAPSDSFDPEFDWVTDERDDFAVPAAEPAPVQAEAPAAPALDAAAFDATIRAVAEAFQADSAAAAEHPSDLVEADIPQVAAEAQVTEPAPEAPGAPLPASVLAWRAIVARTQLLPGNAQIAAMIDELLTVLAQDPAPVAGPMPEPAAAPLPVVVEDAGAGDDAEADGSLDGWRRLG